MLFGLRDFEIVGAPGCSAFLLCTKRSSQDCGSHRKRHIKAAGDGWHKLLRNFRNSSGFSKAKLFKAFLWASKHIESFRAVCLQRQNSLKELLRQS